ncbi:hypothetical protein FACS1894204_06270 [Synergistales bacterium]|nr:hypothetical protein FACS1894204_06270 [Synergistales bacterium]
MTPKQERFVQEYLIDLNATQAAIRAGYKEKRADAIGYENLRKPEIKKAIEKTQAEHAKKIDITQDYILKRLRVEAERDEEGSSHGARVNALGLLGKHLGMFVERQQVEHSGHIDMFDAKTRSALLDMIGDE